jgi:uncharacterized coiled-coil DUF342 family protein
MTSQIDERRLRDAEDAMQLDDSRDNLMRKIDQIDDAIRALQSLDDLGQECNEKAWNDMLELQRRRDELAKRIGVKKGK